MPWNSTANRTTTATIPILPTLTPTKIRSTIIIKGTDVQAMQPVIDRLRGDGKTIVSVRPVRETLEDLFMRAVTDPETGAVLKPGASGDQEGSSRP